MWNLTEKRTEAEIDWDRKTYELSYVTKISNHHLSKVFLCEFHHGYIKNKYGDKSRLLFTDNDSLTCEI